MHDTLSAAAPWAHAIFAGLALAALGVAALAARAELRHFRAAGLARCWWSLRLLMPLAFALGGVAAAAVARAQLGSDGAIMAFLGAFIVALPLWFVAHALAGRLWWPALGAARGLWLAASPLALVWALALVGHTLQPLVWSLASAVAGHA